jgi:hypothetical protein
MLLVRSSSSVSFAFRRKELLGGQTIHPNLEE